MCNSVSSLDGARTYALQPPALIKRIDNDSGFVSGDDSDNEVHSALGCKDDHGSTTSIDTCITRHLKEDGRTYHAFNDGACLFPNDEQEQNRLDAQHYLFMSTWLV